MLRELRRPIFCRPFHGLAKNLRRPSPAMNCRAIVGSSAARTLRSGNLSLVVFFIAPLVCLIAHDARARVGDYEGRPISAVEVVLEGTPADPAARTECKAILRV